MKERQTEQKANDLIMEITKENSERISDDLTKIIGRLDAIQGVKN
ncbi:hypothetical protein ACKXGF_07745 [Alkalibacillus sp. S2W]